MATKKNSEESNRPRRPPATTPEGRERQLISMAYDQAELQLLEGSAPAPVVVHFLKLATEREKLEREKLKAAIELDKKKVEQTDQAARLESLYSDAIEKMTIYQGNGNREDYDVYDN